MTPRARYPLRLAVVGCGAVTEAFHLPASLLTPEVEVTLLVDRNLDRAAELAARFDVPAWSADHREVAGAAEAALVATPPASHAAIAGDLLAAGLAVLCEKPLAAGADDARRMVEAAERGGALLATAHSRRFHFNLATVKALLDLEAFGAVHEVVVEDGLPFAWPTQTGYMFAGPSACGVLLENGVHVLDTLLWWLGPAEMLTYRDDALGGVESNAELALRFGAADASVKISRTAELANTVTLRGELGWARCALYDGRRLELSLPHGKAGAGLGEAVLRAASPQDNAFLMAAQLADFARAVVEGASPRADGHDGLAAVELAARCYAARGPRPERMPAPPPGVVV
jgi:predicted dehydrogenase